MENQMTYKTSDTELAAYLMLEGATLVRLENENPRRIAFLLNGLQEWDGFRQKYWQHEAQVSPMKYAGTLRQLKAAVKDHQSNQQREA